MATADTLDADRATADARAGLWLELQVHNADDSDVRFPCASTADAKDCPCR